MARRKGKRKGRRGKSSIALLPVLPVGFVVYNRIKTNGFTPLALDGMIKDMTGADIMAKTFDFSNAKYFWLGEGAAIVAHKVANKTGLNKSVRRLTGGWISL